MIKLLGCIRLHTENISYIAYEISSLSTGDCSRNARYKYLWHTNCRQLKVELYLRDFTIEDLGRNTGHRKMCFYQVMYLKAFKS